MVVINAVVYKRAGEYVAQGYEVSQIGIGRTKKGAIGKLERAIKLAVSTAKENPDAVLISNPGNELLVGLTRVVTEEGREPIDIRQISDHLTLYVYDYKR